MLDLEIDVSVGDPWRVGPVDVFPVFGPRARTVDYLTSVAAASSGLLECCELNPPDRGAVLATNVATVPVLLPAGTLLVGGAQDRVVATGALCPPRAAVVVGVCGVEPDRWGPLGPLVPTDRCAPGSVRGVLAASLAADSDNKDTCTADQDAVWYSCAAFTEPDVAGGLDRAAGEVAGLLATDLDRLAPEPDQVGVVCAIGPTVVGLDVFDRPAALARHLRGIVAGHALDAHFYAPAPEPAVDEVDRFLGLLDGIEGTMLTEAGMAGAFRLEGLLSGTGLDADGVIVHLAAFARHRPGGTALIG